MFDFELDSNNNNALIIFSGQLEGDDLYYGDKIDKILKKRNKPYKDVVFLFPKYIESKISEFLTPGSRLDSNLKRSSRADQISLITFNGYADLELYATLIDKGVSTIDFDNSFKQDIIKFGLLSLVKNRKEEIILTAPPGTIFEKPSKKDLPNLSKHLNCPLDFLKTSLLHSAF